VEKDLIPPTQTNHNKYNFVMIKLTRIIEQTGYEGQYYDLGRDFANFGRNIDGADEQIKQKFERIIGSKLVGKRIKARASRGYKQYIKDYEFDAVKVTLDDYYDNYVVVAHDNTTPKAKEYFLKPGFKIQILGPATGQPSPQKGDKPGDMQPNASTTPAQPKKEPDSAQHQQMALAPAGHTPTEEPVREQEQEQRGTGFYDAYPIDDIAQDIKSWLPPFLVKPETALRDFIKGLGWQRNLGRGTSVSLYDLKVPANTIKPNTGIAKVRSAIVGASKQGSTIDVKYDLVKIEPDEARATWNIRIKKTITDKSYI